MSDHKPFFKKVEDEVNAFLDLWKRKRGLAVIASFALIIFVVVWGVNWFKRGVEIQELRTENRTLTDELNVIRTENKSLRETVAPLLKQAAEKFPGEEISMSLKKLIPLLQKKDLYEQPIGTASATVEVTIESNEPLNTNYMDRGGYLAFGKRSKALIVMANTQCTARQIGNGQVVYRGIFTMDAAHPANGKPLSILKDSEYAQISFIPIPSNSKVLSGRAICIFNSQKRIEIEIPSQQMVDEKILVPDLKKYF